MTSRTDLFPPSYAPWLASRFPLGVSEQLATCDSCAMVRPEGLTRDPGPFQAHLKCCTYFPFIPNFGLGALLNEYTEAGRVRLAAASRPDGKGGLLLPLGLFAAPEHEERVKRAGVKGFGRREDLLCPFFDSSTSGCSIWKTRPGVCATYFCKSERGAEGLDFWKDVETYLNLFEWTLANEVLWRLGFTEDDIEKCEAIMLTDEPGEEREWLRRSAWAEWYGRENAFYQLCAERAAEVSSDEIAELMGDEGQELEESLKASVEISS